MSVKLQNVSKSYSNQPVIQNLSFESPHGQRLVLLGESGVGKTTILKLIAGLEEPTRGTICIGGKNVTGLAARQRAIGFVFQDNALWPGKTVYEHLRLPLKWRGTTYDANSIHQTLSLVRLSEKTYNTPEQLSGGQRQRVAIARALVTRPHVVLMDEPFSDLDPMLRSSLRREVSDLQQELAFSLIFVTHDCQEALELGHRILILRDGKVIQLATPDDLLKAPADSYVARFLGYQNIFHALPVPNSPATFDIPELALDNLTLPNPSFPLHSKVDVVFKPHALSLLPDNPRTQVKSKPLIENYHRLLSVLLHRVQVLPGGRKIAEARVESTGSTLFVDCDETTTLEDGIPAQLLLNTKEALLVPDNQSPHEPPNSLKEGD